MAKEAKNEFSIDGNKSVLELQMMRSKLNHSIRNARIQRALKALAKNKNKSFNLKRHEANFNDAISSHLDYRIDDALDVLEIILDID